MSLRVPPITATLAALAMLATACGERSPGVQPNPALADVENGTDPGLKPADSDEPLIQRQEFSASVAATEGGLKPQVTVSGRVSLSVDGAGTNAASKVISVQKPAGATVRAAYLAAASTGFSNRVIANGDVRLDGAGATWTTAVRSSINSNNHWADVTALVKPKVDAAAPGRVDFSVTEVSSFGIDGEVLAVIFDDPNQLRDNTIVLLFGAQQVSGDDFFVQLERPLDTSDPALVMDMSLGISFGFQGVNNGFQRSTIDVNGARLSSSAGGQDDGEAANGALLTVGGLDDSNANPPPTVISGPLGTRTDDELYDLRPFAEDGATLIHVHTVNPSNDDNIFFSAFFMSVKGKVVVEPPTNHAPVANPGGPYGGAEGSMISFNGSASSDEDGDALTYAWDFGDGASSPASTSPTANHSYADNGEFTATLTVSDGTESRSQTASVSVTNVAPLASFAAPGAVDEGSSFELSLSSVTDPSSADVAAGFEYAFDCGGGDGYGPFTASATATCATIDNGVRSVSAKVRDKDGGASEYAGSVTVNNVPPTVSAGADATIYSGESFTLNGSFSDPGLNDANWNYTIDWSNGPPTSSFTATQGLIADSHVYLPAGVYTVQLSVTDKDLATGSDIASVTVLRLPVSGGAGEEVINIEGVGQGVVSIDVISDARVDATTILPGSATLGDEVGSDTPVAKRNNGTWMYSIQDLNGDGRMDMTLKFRRDALVANGDVTDATVRLILLSDLSDGRQIRGVYNVRIVP